MSGYVEMRPAMVTIREAAEKTGLPYSCILRMCHEGRLPYITSGKKFYVNFNGLCRMLNEGVSE